MRAKLFPVGGGVLAALGLAFYKLSRFDAEEMPYEVRGKKGGFELRHYPAFAVARTGLRNDQDDSFQRLFDFISGANNRREKIPMTVPVLLERERGAAGTMSFLMPKAIEERGVPHPYAPEIELAQRPPAEVAVVRFRGGTDEKKEQRALAQLRDWMRTQNLEAEGEPIIAYYDSPFIPGLLRRNEAMMRISHR